MDNKTNDVLVSGGLDEWYQVVFCCAQCGCSFMTYLNNRLPRNYCPNCGVKFNKEVYGDG